MYALDDDDSDVYDALPDVFQEALLSPDVTDVWSTDSGEGWIERYGSVHCVGDVSRYIPTFLCLAASASSTRDIFNEENPSISCKLPNGERLVGKRPPLGKWSCSIRRPFGRRIEWDEWVDGGSITHNQVGWIREMVSMKSRGLLSGVMGSGKTTMLETILGDEFFCFMKTVMFQNVEELMGPRITTNYNISKHFPIEEAYEVALRENAKVFIVGEGRSGREIKQVLEAMGSGHASWSTLHARSVRHIPMRIDSMLRSTGDKRTPEEIRLDVAQSVDFCIHMKKLDDGRRVVDGIATMDPDTGEMHMKTF